MRLKKGINIDLSVKDVSTPNRVSEGDTVLGVLLSHFTDQL